MMSYLVKGKTRVSSIPSQISSDALLGIALAMDGADGMKSELLINVGFIS